MGKLLLTGVDGNLGAEAARVLLTLEDKSNLIFCGYSEDSLKGFAAQGVETHVTDFNYPDGLAEAFKGADVLALISMYEKEKEDHQKELDNLRAQLNKALEEKSLLSMEVKGAEDKTKLAVLEAVRKVETEKNELANALNDEKHELENALNQEKEKGKILLEQKEKEVEFYKDLKTKMSTKMVGETLEQHCEIQFNQLRATAFRNAYFEKDNDARSGSKGDYIYRECDENGVEI